LKKFTIALQPKSVASRLRLYRYDASQFHDDIDGGSGCGISAGNLGNAERNLTWVPDQDAIPKTLTLDVEPHKEVGKEDAA
jgi:hypothetical protein